jgi:hypothetical protein
MISVEIFKGEWCVDKLTKDKIYVFNDNNAKIGKYGLSNIRNMENSMGIRVRKGPSKNKISFYNDNEYELNIFNITEDILNIKREALSKNKKIVFSSLGYGNGVDNLYSSAPKTYEFLKNQLIYHFGFDNTKGVLSDIIPSKTDISKSIVISLDKSNLSKSMIVSPSGISFNVNNESIYDLIKSGKKIAFTQNVSYKPGSLILFSLNGENLLCQVSGSYPLTMIDKNSWCLFECFNEGFLNNNIDIYNTGYLQTHFRFLFLIDSDGNIKNHPLISCEIKETLLDDIESDILENYSNMDTQESPLKILEKNKIEKDDRVYVDELLSEIEKLKDEVVYLKTPLLIRKYKILKNYLISVFSRKTIDQILKKYNLNGDLSKIDNIIGKGIYYKLVNEKYTHYIEFKIGRFKNNVNILITFKNKV